MVRLLPLPRGANSRTEVRRKLGAGAGRVNAAGLCRKRGGGARGPQACAPGARTEISVPRFHNRGGSYRFTDWRRADARSAPTIWPDIPDPQAPLGLRSIGITGVGAAVANAVYKATGKRIRELPITLDKLMGDWRRQLQTGIGLPHTRR